MFCRISISLKREKPDDAERADGSAQKTLNFGDYSWVKAHHEDNLIDKLKNPNGEENSYLVNLTELQRLHLRQLQHKLLQHTIALRYRALEPPGWTEDLQQYTQALRDYDYMGKFKNQPGDPFIITGQRYIERCMLNVAMKEYEDEEPLNLLEIPGDWEPKSVEPAPIGGTRTENYKTIRSRASLFRTGLAGLGGFFLVGPMWLMVLHNTRNTVLISTTVLIFVFGFLMALFPIKPMEVMASTAAYAAVLVVFVGLNVDSNAAASV